jgi:hypothetical protein
MALIPRPRTTGRPRNPGPVGYTTHHPLGFTARSETQAVNLIGAIVGRYLSRNKDPLYVGKVVSIRTVPSDRLRMSYTAYTSMVVYQPQYDDDMGDGYDFEELNGKELIAARTKL